MEIIINKDQFGIRHEVTKGTLPNMHYRLCYQFFEKNNKKEVILNTISPRVLHKAFERVEYNCTNNDATEHLHENMKGAIELWGRRLLKLDINVDNYNVESLTLADKIINDKGSKPCIKDLVVSLFIASGVIINPCGTVYHAEGEIPELHKLKYALSRDKRAYHPEINMGSVH